MVKKSLYVFLTAFLGVLLFLILDRIVVFSYLYFVGAGLINSGFDYLQFVEADFFSLIIVLMLGAWYGIWLGLNWYAWIYEQGSHNGLAGHLVSNYWPARKQKDLQSHMVVVKRQLQDDLGELEDLVKLSAAQKIAPEPIVRKIVRKRAPRKTTVGASQKTTEAKS